MTGRTPHERRPAPGGVPAVVILGIIGIIGLVAAVFAFLQHSLEGVIIGGILVVASACFLTIAGAAVIYGILRR